MHRIVSLATVAGLALACFVAGAPRPAFAQPSPAASAALNDANALFARSEWDPAAAAYERIVAAEPANGAAWQNLGESLLRLRRYDEAIRAYGRAKEAGFRPFVNDLNAARAQAARGDRKEAIAALERIVAAGAGPRLRPLIVASTEFEPLRDDPAFKAVLDATIACRTPPYRQFDFWVGEWEVRDPADNVVGRNRVTLEQGGCLIVENWESARGGQTGSSFNYYDVRDRKWHQLYIDNSGNAGAFPPLAGELKDGRMVLLSDEKTSPVSRWTWYAVTPDRVRQMAEQSTDGQKTWQTTWDSYYVRKPK